mmetsp:Transcript_45127/g.105897  ORF Transcript_45127/g.105897 Transcript_45127/m.105897 type:complete len:267 (+) Transcript_45127:200-1000(+)
MFAGSQQGGSYGGPMVIQQDGTYGRSSGGAMVGQQGGSYGQAYQPFPWAETVKSVPPNSPWTQLQCATTGRAYYKNEATNNVCSFDPHGYPFVPAVQTRGAIAPPAQAAPPKMDSEMAELLAKAGAKSGAITISLMWDHTVDLDTQVECIGPPSKGSKKIGRITYNNKRVGNGQLDVDMTTGQKGKVENVYWKTPEAGTFKYTVNHYSAFQSPVSFQVCLQSEVPLRLFDPNTNDTINPNFIGVWNTKGTFEKKTTIPVIAWEVAE